MTLFQTQQSVHGNMPPGYSEEECYVPCEEFINFMTSQPPRDELHTDK